MNRKYISLLIVTAIVGLTCCTPKLKTGLVQFDNRYDAVKNAIIDFSSKPKLYRKSLVFQVTPLDTLHKNILRVLDDGTSEWVSGEAYEGIIAVGISANDNKFLVSSKDSIGSKTGLPSRFIERDGKLFFWFDREFSMTQETLSILKKYNLLVDDEDGKIFELDYITDDAQKGVTFYFCRNDLTKYKKVITNRAMGFYEPPKLNCGSK